MDKSQTNFTRDPLVRERETPLIKFTIITLFEDAIRPYLEASMMWKATKKGIAEFDFVNLRDFGLGPHKSVDDTPYGGGDGMLLRCEPVFAAIESVKEKDPSAEVILPTPAGQTWTQNYARELAGIINGGGDASRGPAVPSHICATGADGDTTRQDPCHYIVLCPHYEGYDERILTLVDHQISLGHYVLTGGELPALIIIDSVVRLLPGVLGGETSAAIESFSDTENSEIEFPQYTKPADFRGLKVPDVLLSGNHGEIAKWRESHKKKA